MSENRRLKRKNTREGAQAKRRATLHNRQPRSSLRYNKLVLNIMARQYIPFSQNVSTKDLIIYPVLDENPLKQVFSDQSAITEHLQNLYQKFDCLKKGQYHIVFVWNLEGKKMTDVWIHSLNEWSDSGPILECHTFRELEECTDAGIASGDSIIALGREEELRRSCSSLEEYLRRVNIQPVFPEEMQPDKNFI